MRRLVGQVALVGALLSVVALGGAGIAFADTGGGLANISHQVSDLQKQLADLQAKGQSAKPGELSASADCSRGEASQPFAAFGDSGSYSLVPQGDLANTSEWSLKNVAVAGDHDPFTPGSSSLLFSKGDSEAVTPVMCAGPGDSTLRFFVTDRGGAGDASLEVKVLYEDVKGGQHDLTLATLSPGEQWEPSPAIPVGVNVLASASESGWTPVAFSFKAHGLHQGETLSLDGPYLGAAELPTESSDPATDPIFDPSVQLVDISRQIADMQKKLGELQAKGQTARTGELTKAATCGFGNTSQVFLPWGDPAQYSLAPQGDLSSTSDWSLKNVDLSSDHDPFSPGSNSLLFARGDSEAVTPVMCVNLDDPTLRVFAADRGGNGKALLQVKVIYEGLDGHPHNLTIANLKVGDGWQPSIVMPMGVNLLAAASGSGWTPVAFDFEVHGLQKGETFSLDGIYVDPWRWR
ncbi:MAG TPA: hypothetical protein VE088_08920 [Gaiellaceae bacterium]|jgi:hypothetical protein|nr:hypothetical protein [Gaiellaceae bacterium]